MIDYTKIEEFKSLDGKKSKLALAEYAKQEFDISLNRKFKFEEMLNKLESSILKQEEVEKDETEQPELVSRERTIEQPKEEPIEHSDEVVGNIPDVEQDIQEEKTEQPKSKPVVLEDDFVPLFGLISSPNSFCTLSWWIYDWINTNRTDWKEKIADYPNDNDKNVLKTLLYYIKRDGYVTVRETRNSRFDTLL